MRVRHPLLALVILLAAAAVPPVVHSQDEPDSEARARVSSDIRDMARTGRILSADAEHTRTRYDLERAANHLASAADDLDQGAQVGEVRAQLRDIARNLRTTRGELTADDMDRLSRRIRTLIRQLERTADGLANDGDPGRGWWIWSNRDDPDSHARRQAVRDRWRAARSRIRSHAPSYVGAHSERWPYRKTGPYRPAPVIRYNRVDGLVLGIRRDPLDWDSFDRARLFGHVGYAFALGDARYEIGGEARLGKPYRLARTDFKVGIAYREDTGTDDSWKLSQAENSLAAFFVRRDYYDYFETEGWTAYAVLRASPGAQLTVAWRSEEYRSLTRNATWSLFGGDAFPLNPPIDEGRMHSVFLAIDGGRIRGYRAVPRGAAFRLTAEIGTGLGGDFDDGRGFNRFVGDVHAYARTGPAAGLALRLRAGTSTGELPSQKRFTLGGIGTVRAFPQHVIGGPKMLLFNAEYSLYGHDLFDDLIEDVVIFGLFDAGWTSGPGDIAFDVDDVLPAAGVGVGFGDRTVRLELAFPLRDHGYGHEPTLWLRLSPTL